ncbi:MAG: hypothetical protein IPM07_26915 [Anaerolineales bacterium]|nr:hypothetical protein [Anaerolineales bacterium]
MNEPIAISSRAADNIRTLIEQSQRTQDTLRTFVEAIGSQLDVLQGWRFATQAMAFVPPTNPAATVPATEPDPNG